MDRRSVVYQQFQQFAQEYNDRTMDQICSAGQAAEFSLQPQQQFLKQYVAENPGWKKLLLYHQIGSGKTCSAITLAEAYMAANPGHKVTVILPARLRTNFLDELASPCADNKYLTQGEAARLVDPNVSDTTKDRLRGRLLRNVSAKYDIMSFEKFVGMAEAGGNNLLRWVQEFTQNRLIIVDEVHNLISSTYDVGKWAYIREHGNLPKKGTIKGVNSILFKYLNYRAHESCKMLFLTATPVFDNMTQFQELVTIMKPTVRIGHNDNIKTLIGHLRGMISYFPGTSPNTYPAIEYQTHEVEMSITGDEVIAKIQEDAESRTGGGEDGEDMEAFMVRERQASVACLPAEARVALNMNRVLDNLEEYAPKIKALVDQIEQHSIGKHVVYSTFVTSGTKVVAAALRRRGWISYEQAARSPELWKTHKYKVFAMWDGSVDDSNKQNIKRVVNGKTNMDGALIRVLIGSPSIKEGVSIKHAQHLHILDPVWNSSAKMQIEGRAVRYCSHVDIPANHPVLRRVVTVHIYKLVPMDGGDVQRTADQQIYDDIIPRKQRRIEAAERALKKVSLDYHLFRRLHQNREWDGVVRVQQNHRNANGRSMISVNEENDDVPTRRRRREREPKQKNTCPKARRPRRNRGCPDGYTRRINKQKFPCCYKTTRTRRGNTATDEGTPTVTTGCPAQRRPVNGNCEAGYAVKTNKHGAPCCYKTTRAPRTTAPRA